MMVVAIDVIDEAPSINYDRIQCDAINNRPSTPKERSKNALATEYMGPRKASV